MTEAPIDTESALWQAIESLWLLGPRYYRLVRLIDRRACQLADSALADHPSRPDALAEMQAWQQERDAIAEQVKVLKADFCRRWLALSNDRRAKLQAIPDWPKTDAAVSTAAHLWAMAQGEARRPEAEEVPF